MKTQLSSPFTIIKQAFEIFTKKENFIFLVKIYLPIGLISVISLLFINIPFLSKFISTPGGNFVMIGLDILLSLIAVFVNLAGIISIIEIEKGNKITVKKVYKISYAKYLKFFLLTLITYFIYALGVVLMVIPFFLFITWFAFSKFAMVESGLGIKASLLQSKKNIKGKFWKILPRIVIFGIFSILCQMALGTLPYGTGSLVFYLCGALFTLPTFLLYKETIKSSVNE